MFPTLAIAMTAVLAAALAPWLGADSRDNRRQDSVHRTSSYPGYPDVHADA
jgi:hypothetical protein